MIINPEIKILIYGNNKGWYVKNVLSVLSSTSPTNTLRVNISVCFVVIPKGLTMYIQKVTTLHEDFIETPSECCLWELKNIEGKGVGMIAKTLIKKG